MLISKLSKFFGGLLWLLLKFAYFDRLCMCLTAICDLPEDARKLELEAERLDAITKRLQEASSITELSIRKKQLSADLAARVKVRPKLYFACLLLPLTQRKGGKGATIAMAFIHRLRLVGPESY
eukprot:scaffold98512_cov35-Prasinocladus_malaysianus.AAC.3